jgi:phage terminase small subunit
VEAQGAETMKKLTPKERLFCREYIKDYNASRSMVASGYSANNSNNTGYKMSIKPHIKEYIEKMKREREEVVGIDAAWVLKEAEKMYHKCSKKDDDRTAHSFLKLCGDHTDVGAFSKNVRVDDARVDHLSVDELQAKRARLQARIDEQA